jgi:type I restriction enzyme S subunit
MNAERLLAHYEKIADAPDAIARLRRFVLDLAVRGKLVPQDPNDEPPKGVGKSADPTAPFQLPSNWKWIEIGDQLDLLNGMAFKPTDWAKEGLRIVRIQNLNNPDAAFNFCNPQMARERSLINDGSFLVSWSGTPGTSFGAFIWDRGPAVLNQHIFRCDFKTKAFVAAFLRLAINGRLDEMIAKAHGGVGLQHITKGKLEALLIPLPPLAEQHRIVAKVDELMALCDRLQAARQTREATRDRLTAASLARLNAPAPETGADPAKVGTGFASGSATNKKFQDDARFALDALPALTTRTDQIKRLRQTILNLAVRGKLVPQDPYDEPASELLKRIAKEKVRAGKRKTVETEIDNEEELGELPPTWRAVPLIALGSWAIGSGFPKNEQGLESGPHFFLKVSDMNLPGNEKYITTSNNFIDDDAARRMRAKIHPPGTVIFPKIGGAIATNKRRILTRGSAIDNNCLGITFSSALNIEWAYLLLTTLDFTRYQAGTAVPALQQEVLERIPVGLPPLAEQHRIVAKVDELMALCDRLEASLATADETRRRLLEALLAEALAPADARELEAAE